MVSFQPEAKGYDNTWDQPLNHLSSTSLSSSPRPVETGWDFPPVTADLPPPGGSGFGDLLSRQHGTTANSGGMVFTAQCQIQGIVTTLGFSTFTMAGNRDWHSYLRSVSSFPDYFLSCWVVLHFSAKRKVSLIKSWSCCHFLWWFYCQGLL